MRGWVKRTAVLAVGAVGLIALVAADCSGDTFGFEGQVKLPNGTVATILATYNQPDGTTNTLPGADSNGRILFFLDPSSCSAIYYPGELTIAQDMSSAVLKVTGTQWGDLTMHLTSSMAPAAGTPMACPGTDPTATSDAGQQFVTGGGEAASGTYTWTVTKGGTHTISGTVSNASVGVYAFDVLYTAGGPSGTRAPIIGF